MFGFLAMVCILQCGMAVYSQDQSEFFFQLAKRSACSSLKPNFVPSHTDLADFNGQMKDWHNYFRCFHGSGDVTIDDDLVATAQAWAETMAARGSYGHSTGRNGENVYVSWGYDDSPVPVWKIVRGDATDPKGNYGHGWYCMEHNKYNYNFPGYQKGTGHFTQVVWKPTTKLGCGIKMSGFTTYVACQYSPTGNFGGSSSFKNAVPGLQNGVSVDTVCPSTNS